jgi:Meckel syndrome type 1 protein
MLRMRWLHPNDRQIAWPRFAQPLVLGLSICLVGCTNQQMSASNPFIAPDRVPPPATRTIAPGTAAPYYPGNPVPAAQIAPPAPPVAEAQAVAPLADVAAVAPAAPPATAPKPLEFANERSVAIPTDNQDLRFALPAPPPVNQPAAPPAEQVAAAAAPASAVVPAAFNQPVANQSPVPPPTPTASSSGPWRSPQVPPSSSSSPGNYSSPVMQAQYVQPQPAQPTMLVAQPQPMQPQAPPPAPVAAPMPVELRPTSSPQVSPAALTAMAEAPVVPAPRMRFPSLLEPSTWFTPQPPAANQQLVGYMVPGPDGQMHMISVEQYQASLGGGGAQPAPSVAGGDGFRPRGTSTK